MVINRQALVGGWFLNGGFILSLLAKPLRSTPSPVISVIHLIHHAGGQELADHVKRQEGACGEWLVQVSLKTLPSNTTIDFNTKL